MSCPATLPVPLVSSDIVIVGAEDPSTEPVSTEKLMPEQRWGDALEQPAISGNAEALFPFTMVNMK
jgi:hypothetical protein